MMDDMLLSESEYRIMDIIWDNAPIESGKLVKLCESQLSWKKSTTYTMLKRLQDKGYVRSERTVVTSLVTREQVRAAESEAVVEQRFAGSLPGFLVAFLGNKTLSEQEAEELKRLIDAHREG